VKALIFLPLYTVLFIFNLFKSKKTEAQKEEKRYELSSLTIRTNKKIKTDSIILIHLKRTRIKHQMASPFLALWSPMRILNKNMALGRT